MRSLTTSVLYLITRVTLTALTLFRWTRKSTGKKVASTLCLAAGERGWELLEYKELLASAREYLGEKRVYQHIVAHDRPYLRQTREALERWKPTHYYYDPRTGAQQWGAGLWQALRLAVMLHNRGITPICALTDIPMRLWRAQCAMVSALQGSVIIFMRPRDVQRIFPHRRLYGPSLMALSAATVKAIESYPPVAIPQNTAVFVGSLYEPRTTILRHIQSGLEQRGFFLEIRGRTPGMARISDAEYWGLLKGAPVVLTTADPAIGPGMDSFAHPHVVYRYLEALASGSCLVAPAAPGVERFFTPGEHFAAFTSPDEAVHVIEHLLKDPDARARIARQGQLRAKALTDSRIFWTLIDTTLGRDSLT